MTGRTRREVAAAGITARLTGHTRSAGRAAIKARLDAVTGPWVLIADGGARPLHLVASPDGVVVARSYTVADAALIAHAPTDLAVLLAETERLTAALIRANAGFEKYERLYFLQAQQTLADLRDSTTTPNPEPITEPEADSS